MQTILEVLVTLAVLAVIAAVVAAVSWILWRTRRKRFLAYVLKQHFFPTSLSRIAITERQFPSHIRADLQRAVDAFFENSKVLAFYSIPTSNCSPYGGLEFASLLHNEDETTLTTPPQYEEIDIGEDEPVQALKNGLWLLKRGNTKFAVLYAPYGEFNGCGFSQRMRLQVAADGTEEGATVAKEFFRHLETAVLTARSYRGKVLSLEHGEMYSGAASGVKVHRLGPVQREEVILCKKTLELLDRNVIDFVRHRERLGAFRMATKKGLLFYGPPGTGKTHTIRYLASSLPKHTTLLISAEQVALLGEYMTLARLLQPSIVVMEDVDLIARNRADMNDPRSEILLNKLLNEMDGLREDCEIVFLLTTNRPEQLESALASRPGRIDQSIEFPLPEAAEREKLVRLYSQGIDVSGDLVDQIVKRTERVSASFIKELMRRATQFHLERNGTGSLDLADVENALDEMLFCGGSLNLKLLGAEQRIGEG